jgi:hypothetical protein
MIEKVWIDEHECFRVYINGTHEATFFYYEEAALYLKNRRKK